MSSSSPLKVVLHVSDCATLAHALANAGNLQAARPDTQIRLLLNGPAVTAVQGQNSMTARLGQLMAAGVTVQLCRHALRAQQIDEASLPAGLEVVPAGIVALAEAQAAGWAYIKP